MSTIKTTINGVSVEKSSKFYQDIISDDSKTIHIASSQGSRDIKFCLYNLIIASSQMSLYTKGLKPHRHFKVSDIKAYFGLKGSSAKVNEDLQSLKEYFFV